MRSTPYGEQRPGPQLRHELWANTVGPQFSAAAAPAAAAAAAAAAAPCACTLTKCTDPTTITQSETSDTAVVLLACQHTIRYLLLIHAAVAAAGANQPPPPPGWARLQIALQSTHSRRTPALLLLRHAIFAGQSVSITVTAVLTVLPAPFEPTIKLPAAVPCYNSSCFCN